MRSETDFETVLERFESGGLVPEAFPHEAHVYVAWRLIRRDGLSRGGRRFSRGLRRWTRAWGVEAKYHATITGAWLRIVHAGAAAAEWSAFRAAHPDLFRGSRALLERHYSPERLDSPRARSRFVPPDRAPLPAARRPVRARHRDADFTRAGRDPVQRALDAGSEEP